VGSGEADASAAPSTTSAQPGGGLEDASVRDLPLDSGASSQGGSRSTLDAGVAKNPTTDAGPPPTRVFFTGPTEVFTLPLECRDPGDCQTGERCYRLAEQLGICDRDTSDWGCTADECSCGQGGGPAEEAEVACPRDQRCVTYEETCSCAPSYLAGCVEAGCASDQDCVDGTVCTPPSYMFPPVATQGARCRTPLCTRDEDCVDGPRGRCSLLLTPPSQAGEVRLQGIRCVYESPDIGPDACQGTSASTLIGEAPDTRPYYCFFLDR
jgi:hypothetical protein